MSDTPLSVSELTARIKQVLEQGFAHVRVSGEISRLTRPASGHLYFTIKDRHAALSAVIWRSTVARLGMLPEESGEFVFSGHLSLYEPRGSYQLVVTRIEPAGAGRLAAEFERRKQLFAERGWFDPENRKKLPALPRHIGIVTSATAAAFEDVRKVLATRPGWLRLTHAPCLVQGEQAPASIASALHRLGHMRSPPDLILLVRGGGSIEDLWCFNDEQVVRAIVDCPVPVMTGIGHEIDITLADYAADLRAATPSNAVELACPSRDELRERLPRMAMLYGIVQQQLMRWRRELSQLEQRGWHAWERRQDARHHACEQKLSLLAHQARNAASQARRTLRGAEKNLARQEPAQRLRLQRRQSTNHAMRLAAAIHRLQQRQRQRWQPVQERLMAIAPALTPSREHRLLHASQRLLRLRGEIVERRRQGCLERRHRLGMKAGDMLNRHKQQRSLLDGKLQALGPMRVLQRGYSLSYAADGSLITRASRLTSGDIMTVRFVDGKVDAMVRSVDRQEVS